LKNKNLPLLCAVALFAVLFTVFFTVYIASYEEEGEFTQIGGSEFYATPQGKIYALIPSGGKFELKGARADKFRVLASGGYRGRNVGADESAVYCGNLAMIGLDPTRARAIGNGYFTDGRVSYFCSDIGERNHELGAFAGAVQTAAYALLGADKPQSYIYKTRRVSSVNLTPVLGFGFAAGSADKGGKFSENSDADDKKDVRDGAQIGSDKSGKKVYFEGEELEGADADGLRYVRDTSGRTSDFYVTDALTLTAGLRYNYDKDYGGHIAPRGYVVYHLSENLSFKGGVSAGYTTPNIDDRTEGLKIPINHGRGIRLGKSSLKPETSVNYEIGASYDNNENLSFSATAFHTDFKDKVDSVVRCGGWGSGADFNNPSTWTCVYQGKTYFGIYENINVGKAEINGLELTADWKILSNLAFRANYTYAKSKQKSGDNEGKSLTDTPRYMIKTGLDYDLSKDLNLWAQMNYMSRVKNGVYVKTKGYAVTDVGMNYKITKNASINFSVYNLFDEKFIDEHPTRYLIAEGRKFQLGFNVNF